MGKIVTKILQGSAVTLAGLGGLATYLLVVNFPQCMSAKNYENWLRVDKLIAIIKRMSFFGPWCSHWFRTRW